MKELHRGYEEWAPGRPLLAAAYVGALSLATGIVLGVEGAFRLGEKLAPGAEACRKGGRAVKRFYQKHIEQVFWRWLGTATYGVAVAFATVIVGIAAAASLLRDKVEAGAGAWQAWQAGRKGQVPKVAPTTVGTHPAEVTAGAAKTAVTRVRVFSKRIAAAPETEEVEETEEATR